MIRHCVGVGCLLIAASVAVPSARGQWGYPGGFGGFGWGGWGATTALGDEARGMGIFAAGMGQYNLNTAAATSINADTAMRFNEYIWQSQQIRNQRFFQRQAERRERVNESARTIYTRLSTNPERRDVHRGDALNILLDQLTAPGVYSRSISAAHAPLAVSLVMQIPFKHAPQAITISLEELNNHVPKVLMAPEFEAERDAFKSAVAEARKEADETDSITADTLRTVQTTSRTFREKVQATIPVGSPERRVVNNHLKGTLGLVRMLESADVSTFLKELEKTDSTTLDALLGFMQTFNLRFGVASTPAQRNAYDELFTRLRGLRDQLFPTGDAPDAIASPGELHPEWAEAFFSGMRLEDMQDRKPLTPAEQP